MAIFETRSNRGRIDPERWESVMIASLLLFRCSSSCRLHLAADTCGRSIPVIDGWTRMEALSMMWIFFLYLKNHVDPRRVETLFLKRQSILWPGIVTTGKRNLGSSWHDRMDMPDLSNYLNRPRQDSLVRSESHNNIKSRKLFHIYVYISVYFYHYT